MKVKLATAFVTGFLVAVILGFIPARRPGCRTGDMTVGIRPEKAKALEDSAWMHYARECRVGDYLVYAPAREGFPDILLARTGKPFLGVSKDTTTLIDADGHRVLYQWDRAKSVISYAGYDVARHAWIDNLDFGADGVVDFRTTEISGRQVKQELNVGDRWLEFLKGDGKGDGKTGVFLDGKFMSIDDARKKLAATGGPVQ
jgi:hypothetical protein